MIMRIDQGRLLGVKQVESLHFNERPMGELITLLVIHNISLPPNQYGGPYVEQLFTGCLDPNEHDYFKSIYQLKVSSHLFIRRTGETIQFVPFDKRAWHAGVSSYQDREDCNNFSIGIELEGCDTEPFTIEQYQHLALVTQCLKINYPIKDIVGHSDIAVGRKTDPGPYFDWNLYYQLFK